MRARDETIACSVGIDEDTSFGAVTPPIHLSANYSFAGFREPRAYDYTRSGNPTRDQLAEALTKLERGAGAIVTGSGMSAIHLVLSLVPTGGVVIAPHDCYGGTGGRPSPPAEGRGNQGGIFAPPQKGAGFGGFLLPPRFLS